MKTRAVWQRLVRAKCQELWPTEEEAFDDIKTYVKFSDSRFALQDMYETIRVAECGLHSFIRSALVKQLGEARWWQKGIPLGVRKECVCRREDEGCGEEIHPYGFTDTIHLKTILEGQWKLFEPYMRRVNKDSRFKKELLAYIGKMNTIRRRVMHPVRGFTPNESHFEVVRSVRRAANELAKSLHD